jgi:hypothetical protein
MFLPARNAEVPKPPKKSPVPALSAHILILILHFPAARITDLAPAAEAVPAAIAQVAGVRVYGQSGHCNQG